MNNGAIYNYRTQYTSYVLDFWFPYLCGELSHQWHQFMTCRWVSGISMPQAVIAATQATQRSDCTTSDAVVAVAAAAHAAAVAAAIAIAADAAAATATAIAGSTGSTPQTD